jgi:2-polyprenyl-3-methyl-5-hydroxy-6-metoxy-1,4-benzoquinol methylase
LCCRMKDEERKKPQKEDFQNYEELILNHYRRIAKNCKDGANSTMEDQVIRNAEIKFFTMELKNQFPEGNFSLLDAGCGNGYLLSILRQEFPKARLFGLEFTPELWEIASLRKLPKVEIINHDLRKNDWFSKKKFDVIITERVIINILDRKDQYTAIENLAAKLKVGGLYLHSESYRAPLEELNSARRENLLEEVEESYQNLYLKDTFAMNLKQYGLEAYETVVPENYLSTHFFVSRVFHKMVRPEGGKVKFSRFADFFEKALPPAVGNYSPILFCGFKKTGKKFTKKEIYSEPKVRRRRSST